MNIEIPKIVYGSSALGNLYEAVPYEKKRLIVEQWLRHQPNLAVIDSAGKYGAGLALESIGRCLKDLDVPQKRVVISNKIGWKRVPMSGPEPTFDCGLWIDIDHDVVECMGYDEMFECFEQGNELLGDYCSQLVSVHDPDEFIARASSEEEQKKRYDRVLDSYRALSQLRQSEQVIGVGVGSKDWRLIQRLFDDGVPLDWVMFANSFTLYSHPMELLEFMSRLNAAGVVMINSAVFNAGFLIGGKWFDYREVSPESDPELFDWRDRFFAICERHNVSPALACCQFGLSVPGVVSLALNTSRPERVADNVSFVEQSLPSEFWRMLKKDGLLSNDYPFL
ncbi:MAG: aldo/keto reductase [Verrucomicrobiota bacterium]